MSIEITNENKNVDEITTERTWRLEIHTPAGGEYFARIFREIAKSIDGEIVTEDRHNVPISIHDISMTDLVAHAGTINYKDKTGADKSIALCDLPFIIPEAIEIIIAEAKTAELP